MVLSGEPIICMNGQKAKSRYEIIDLQSKKRVDKMIKKNSSNINNTNHDMELGLLE